MKELSIEEKARRYDEAINTARNLVKAGLIYEDAAIQVFPELAESEDERIRKELIEYLKERKSCESYGQYVVRYDRWIAWLEKQGEKKSYASETMNEKGDFDNGFTRMVEKEQKPAAWSEEDNIMVHDIDYALRCQITYQKSRLDSMSSWIYNLKNRIQPKQEWSEEYENFMYDTLSNLTELKDRYGAGYGNVGKCIDWLKSIKDRVQPQQEYKWSEDIPYWKKSTLPNDSVTGFNSDFFSYNGYCINYKELFDKLPKED